MGAMIDPSKQDSPWFNYVTLIDETPFDWRHGPLYHTELIQKIDL